MSKTRTVRLIASMPTITCAMLAQSFAFQIRKPRPRVAPTISALMMQAQANAMVTFKAERMLGKAPGRITSHNTRTWFAPRLRAARISKTAALVEEEDG